MDGNTSGDRGRWRRSLACVQTVPEQLWHDGYHFARQNPDYDCGTDEEFEKAKAAAMELEVEGFLELRPLILKEN
jgi:hypothetical protein